MKLHRLIVGSVLILLFAVCASPASAHALLVRSIPDANAQLAVAPAQIELFFSEALDPAFSTASVLDSNGAQVDNRDVRVDPTDPTHLTVSLRPLPDGVYTVAWKALSAADGHVTTGAFPFAVGKAEASGLAAATKPAPPAPVPPAEVVAKWFLYLSAAAMAGSVIFVLAIRDPAVRSVGSDQAGEVASGPLWVSTTRIILTALVAAQVAVLLMQAAQASGGGLAATLGGPIFTILFRTRYGVIWLGRLILIFVLARIAPEVSSAPQQGTRRAWLAWSSLGASLLLLLTISLGSHASADPAPALPVFADWIHLTAAAFWIGGLISFVLMVRAMRWLSATLRTNLAARLIPRFSVMAAACVALLVSTGVYSAVLRVGTFDALIHTSYGQTLLAKTGLLLLMLCLGATNLLMTSPRMRDAARSPTGNAALVDRFGRIVAGEAALGAAILLSVSLLTSLPPARIVATNPSLSHTAEVDDLRLETTIVPGRVGINTFTVRVTSGGQAVVGAKEVDLRFTPASGKIPPSQVQLAGLGNGDYSIKGGYLSLPDTWQVQVAVRRQGKFDSYANFNFSLGAGSPGSGSQDWGRTASVLAALSACAYAAVFVARRRIRLGGGLLGLIPGAALLVLAGFAFYAPRPTNPSTTVNPIPPDAASVARGQATYLQRCVPCHGESGKGDGPVGLTLNPRPADLTVHAVPGVHTDAQLFEWITNGFPGSIMPHFGQVLPANDRWDLVNFIRTFAPKATP